MARLRPVAAWGNPVATALWVPYTYLLIVAALAMALVVASIAGLTRGLVLTEEAVLFWLFAGIPGVLMLGVPLLSVGGVNGWRRLRSRSPRRRMSLRRALADTPAMLLGLIRILSLPARGWVWLWATLFIGVFTHILLVGLACIALMIVGFIASGLASAGVSWWVIGPLAIVALVGTTVGGARWGNQYSSGTTGGFPLGLVIVCSLGFAGWVLVLALLAALAALPLMLWMWAQALLGIAYEPDFLAWALPLAALGAFLVAPLVLDLTDR